MSKKLLIATIFLGSFVSFALEPMVGRALLPVFGGTPGVWIVCLAAFQILMVGGYSYACLAGETQKFSFRLSIHILLLLAAGGWCAYLSLDAGRVLRLTSTLTGIGPVDVLFSVLALVGVAFVLLAANATLVQNLSGGDYRLYAVSNLGSFLGLFAYPLLIEPFVGLSAQWMMLGGALFLYTSLLFLASRNAAAADSVESMAANSEKRPFRTLPYLAIPAFTCALLNAVTTHLTLDIAPLPLLWAVLLGLFLLSYVIGFSGRGKVAVWCAVAAFATLYAIKDVAGARTNNIVMQLGASSALLFCVATFLHSWLYEMRPNKESLGRYYLYNVVGGAIGGSMVSILAPVVFPAVYEYPALVVLSAVSVALYVGFRRGFKFAGTAVAAFAVAGVLSAVFSEDADGRKRTTIHRARGFFGTLRVDEVMAGASDGQSIAIHEFVHGETVHGVQVMRDRMERMPTCYFTPYGCGFSVFGHPKYKTGQPMRVGIVGLGVGVMFAYGRPGDTYRGYEISPEVIETAKNPSLFTFISHCRAKAEIVPGDARKNLEDELKAGIEKYDVLLIDAFTGDNIPYHLSTKEALELYMKLLDDDGVLCVHFSNKHLDLRPYVKRIGEELGLATIVLNSEKDTARLGYATNAALFTRHPEKLAALPVNDGHCVQDDLSGVKSMALLPTDDKGSFLPFIRLTLGEYTE